MPDLSDNMLPVVVRRLDATADRVIDLIIDTRGRPRPETGMFVEGWA